MVDIKRRDLKENDIEPIHTRSLICGKRQVLGRYITDYPLVGIRRKIII